MSSHQKKKNRESKQFPPRKGFENQPDLNHVDMNLIREDLDRVETLHSHLTKDEIRQRNIK